MIATVARHPFGPASRAREPLRRYHPAAEDPLDDLPSLEEATVSEQPGSHVLDAALKRRAELRETSTALVRALESASPGREQEWLEKVSGCLDALRNDVAEHIEITEAEDGLYAEIVAAQPRLSNPVRRLVADHEVMRDRIEALCGLAERAASSPDPVLVKAVRDEGTHVVGLLQRHRQRGSDLIYEAYQTDIGGAG
jgi:hypothetical protein